MKYIKVAPVIGALVIIGLIACTHAVIADTDVPTAVSEVGETPSGTDNIVGEYNLVTGPDVFLPMQLCAVDPKLSVIQQLQQCKNKRKGWLRL
jgi:hypothetical protein